MEYLRVVLGEVDKEGYNIQLQHKIKASTMLACQEVSQEANALRVKFKYTHSEQNALWKYSSSKYICGALLTKFGFSCSKHKNYSDYCLTVSARFEKLLDEDDSTYTCSITSPQQSDLLMNKLTICDDHWIQIAIASRTHTEYSANAAWSHVFEVTLQCEIHESPSVFASIYDDTEFADFKLCGENGSVQIHKTILAAHSPVCQTMLAGEWKESREGSVALEGVSLETLQHLKDYMYLNRLPTTGLQELCLLASYYMMPRLVVQCCAKLINHLTVDDVIEVAEFATRYRVGILYIAVLKTMGGENDKIDKLALKTSGIVDICKKINTTE